MSKPPCTQCANPNELARSGPLPRPCKTHLPKGLQSRAFWPVKTVASKDNYNSHLNIDAWVLRFDTAKRGLTLLVQVDRQRDDRRRFDSMPVQHRRLIAPVLDGVDGDGRQPVIAATPGKIARHPVQAHRKLDLHGSSDCRQGRIDAVEQHGRLKF
jgi:hypothetical protein